jgi:hypothetical protein
MNLGKINKLYALNDGEILIFQIDYKLKKLIVEISVRRKLPRQKFTPCKINFEFHNLSEVSFFEDFGSECDYSDITLLQLDNGDFYLSLDPYGNTGLPNENDNLVIKSKNLIFVDEIGVRYSIY